MTLLYLLDHDDGLTTTLSRFVDDIRVVPQTRTDELKSTEEVCCLIVDLEAAQSMQKVFDCRSQYRDVPMLVVSHERIDMQACVRMGVDGFILYPYDSDQIEQVLSKYRRLKERSDAFDEKERLHRDHITSLLTVDALHQNIRAAEDASLLLVNIDDFDLINTLYEMDMGDKSLAKIAGYLHKMAPMNSSLYRVDADEFAMLLLDPEKDQAEVLSRQIKSFFELTHFHIDGIDINIRVSIGYASGSARTLYHHAKIALKEAKANGKNMIVRYRENSAFLKRQRATLYWLNEVKSALEEDRIHAYFQPVLDNSTKEIIKYEALCRLESTDGEIYQPEQFIEEARLGGVITNVTRAMIDNAFKKFSSDKHEFSINVTREDLDEEYLLAFLKRKCFQYDIAPTRVSIEVVEDTSFDLLENYIKQLRTFADNGFMLVIDDFGKESSNYSRLLDLKADYLKIDGRFIENIDQNVNTRIIVESIVDFAKKIGARTIAKYVNAPSVFKQVQELGVDCSQGFYIGKAQPYLIEEEEIV